jgi:DNA-binding NtrC family response regulator
MPGAVGIVDRSSAMRMQPHAPISPASRRRLAGWLVGSSLQDVERDLVLETLSHTHGNRTEAARLLGVSVRTLRNKIVEYSAEGIYVPRRESQDEILSSTSVLLFRGRDRQSP